jgi:hypothetical protein
LVFAQASITVVKSSAGVVASGDEVGIGHYCGIVMKATPRSVDVIWETQKMGETTTYSKSSADLPPHDLLIGDVVRACGMVNANNPSNDGPDSPDQNGS